MSRVRAIYDFQAEAGSTEINLTAGEVLTVTRRDVGEGWLEGSNSSGMVGLFPAAYVEEMESQPPSMPPPPCPVYAEVPAENEWGNINDWQTGPQPTQNENDEWDDDWDDDSETGSTQPSSNYVTSINTANRDLKAGPVGKKSFNRFSSFVKSGGESYILGALKLTNTIRDTEYVSIYDTGSGVEWEPIVNPYSCVIASPKKESKLKGLKSFIAYQLTPTFNNIQVSRRYKQFDWLHERLQEKFSVIPIPPLPDKQISGRYEEQFIEHRKTQLQAFVNCVCRHPVLSRSAVWMHFITCTDEKQWKAGKRRAEKDELVGATFFLSIKAPEKVLEPFLVEQETEDCSRFILAMDQAVKNLSVNASEQCKRLTAGYNRDCQKVGQAFINLAMAFDLDKTPGNPRSNLTRAIRSTGETYNEIGRIMEEQAKHDWEPLGDVLHIYKGIISSFPEILSVHKGAIVKRKECEKAASSQMEITAVRQRTDVVSYAVMAEINHFHQERAADFKMAMHSFLTEQINFYENIVDKLKGALQAYEY